MSTNITVYDLETYPDNSKTVVVDHKAVVTTGAGGDEKWVLTAYTSATASGSASIQDVFIQSFIVGWAKSAGFNMGPYTISSSQKTLQVSINGSSFRSISLSTHTNPVSGDSVAADMQIRINELATTGAAEAANLAFKNASVTFANGKFTIQSGSPTKTYTGSGKSSVSVIPGATNDVSAHLGFFAPTTSETIAGSLVRETYLTYPYTAVSGLSLIDVAVPSITATGDCVGITDGTNSEFRYVSSVTAGTIIMNAALSNNYAANSRIQVVKMQDPDCDPPSVFESIDDATRFAISTIVNQIDFSV
jgi:hypothetical protein